MTDIELETRGHYKPGFLHIFINTDEDITDINGLALNPDKRQLFSTFLHEYIHFIQEITTISGVLSSGHYINMIRDFNWAVRSTDKKEFTVPAQITNENNMSANMKIRKLLRGDADFISNEFQGMVRYDSYTEEKGTVVDRDGKERTIKLFKVHFNNSTTYQSGSFYFGSLCLKEYVTHTLQTIYYPETSHDDIPYIITELIIRKECPSFPADPMLIVALCDACLMSFNPAEIFFKALSKINEGSSSAPGSVAEVYDLVYKGLGFVDEGEIVTMQELYDKMFNNTIKQLENSMKAEIFAKNLKWLKQIFELGRELRMTTPYFMTDLVKGPSVLTGLCLTIFKRIGTPFYTNNQMLGGIAPGEDMTIPDQPYLLLVFQQVLQIYGGSNSCSLYTFCDRTTSGKITSAECKTAPWEKVKEPELCPFAQLWKTWGLTDKTPVRVSV